MSGLLGFVFGLFALIWAAVGVALLVPVLILCSFFRIGFALIRFAALIFLICVVAICIH
jgi:hypothetical protein